MQKNRAERRLSIPLANGGRMAWMVKEAGRLAMTNSAGVLVYYASTRQSTTPSAHDDAGDRRRTTPRPPRYVARRDGSEHE